jgi:hypothetical protein
MYMPLSGNYDIFPEVHIRKFLMIIVILLLVSCGRSIEKQARDQVRKLSNADLAKNQVSVFSVSEMGDVATAEIDIHTAVKMRRTDGKWLIEEIRLGSRKWEDVHRIVEALDLVRRNDTMADMERIRDAVTEYIRQNGPLALETDFVTMINLLSPGFLEEPIREDAWDNPFIMLVTNEGFQIRSTGSDGRPGNSDDLVLNNEN